MLNPPIFDTPRTSLTYQARFLLAQLHIDSLKDQTSPKAIRRTLEGLPNGSKALEQAYSGAIQRIEDQMEGFRTLAKQVLGWLTYAERLMRVTEVQHAIAVELGTHRFDEDNLSDVNELVSVCAGLVVVDGQSNVIRLVHYTTQEYFEQNGESALPGAQQAIAGSCLTYLLYEDFKSGWIYHDDTYPFPRVYSEWNFLSPWVPRPVMAMLNCHPFYVYAAQYWATHTRNGMDDAVKKLFLTFARDDYKISRSAQVLSLIKDESILDRGRSYGSKISKPVSSMHVLSYLGSDELISMLLEHGFEADTKDNDNATPLWWAVSKGHKKVVELLLSSKTVDVNNVNFRFMHTALFRAATNGDVEIVKLMIAREDVDLNFGDRENKTSLAEAVEKGHSTIVKLLLSRNDVDITAKALATAAQSRKADFAKILLNRADVKTVDQKDRWGRTPFMYAARNGGQEICELFLSRKEVDVNAKDRSGWTPLTYATNYGHRAVIELLLFCDNIKVNARDYWGRTPLILAVKDGYQAVIELLLSHGSVDANIKNSDGNTALMYAADGGHKQIAELLLSHGSVDANIKNSDGNTALMYAADGGHEQLVELFLSHGSVDANIRNRDGSTALV